MAPLIISSPTAAAAYMLVDLLHEHCKAEASPHIDSTWEIRVELSNAPRDVLPASLSTAREWLDQCGLRSASVSLNGHTYLLRGSARPRLALASSPPKRPRS
jgi:hypothetical protein